VATYNRRGSDIIEATLPENLNVTRYMGSRLRVGQKKALKRNKAPPTGKSRSTGAHVAAAAPREGVGPSKACAGLSLEGRRVRSQASARPGPPSAGASAAWCRNASPFLKSGDRRRNGNGF
jgi:hypothetical protein